MLIEERHTSPRLSSDSLDTDLRVSYRIFIDGVFQMRLGSLLISVLLFCGASESCFGQFNGAIQGTVVDQSQSVVPEATVRVVSVSTDVVREAITSADGLYRVLSLAPG